MLRIYLGWRAFVTWETQDKPLQVTAGDVSNLVGNSSANGRDASPSPSLLGLPACQIAWSERGLVDLVFLKDSQPAGPSVVYLFHPTHEIPTGYVASPFIPSRSTTSCCLSPERLFVFSWPRGFLESTHHTARVL